MPKIDVILYDCREENLVLIIHSWNCVINLGGRCGYLLLARTRFWLEVTDYAAVKQSK